MTSLYLSGARYVLTATVVFLHGFFTLDIRQNRCVAVFHHELVTFSLVLCYIFSLFKHELFLPQRTRGSFVLQTDDWSHTLLTGFMGVRPEPVWSLWRSSKRPGDLSLRTSIILPGERSMRGSAMALPGDRSNRGSAMALPGDPTIRLSSIRPGDFSLSSGRLGDLSRRNSVRASL